MWFGKLKVKMKIVINWVFNILWFLFIVNVELFILKFFSVFDWFININYILIFDEDVLCLNISLVIELCWNWKVFYVDYIYKIMYDDIFLLLLCMYVDIFWLYVDILIL